MAGKLTTVLTKREAEAYLEQGLHQEAIKLYDQLLSDTPHIDPAIKAAIQTHREKIEEEFHESAARKSRTLTAAEIARIRDGWGLQATETDILVCAQAFVQIGAFAEALEEFRMLVTQAGLKKTYLHAMADCLVCLHTPDALPPAAQQLAAALTADAKTALVIQVAMAQQIAARSHLEHARTLFAHLADQPALASAMQARIAALGAEARSPATTSGACAAPPVTPSSSGSGMARLRRFFGLRKNGV